MKKQIMSPSATANKENEFICFPNLEENDLLVWTASHIDRTSQESLLRDTSDREKIRSSRTESISSEAQSISSPKSFQSAFNNALLSSKSSENIVRMLINFWFYQACFPGKSHLFRISLMPLFLKVSRSNYFYGVRWDQIQLYFKIAIVFSE